MITEAILAKIRSESRYVLLAENVNPGSPVQQDVYAGDLCDEIDRLRARIAELEAENTQLRTRLAKAELKLTAYSALETAMRCDPDGYRYCTECGTEVCLHAVALRGRAERAEAEADEWYALYQAEEDRREKAENERDSIRAERDRYLAAIVEWTEASVGMDYAIASVYGNRTVDQESPEAKKTIEDARIRLRASKDALRRIAEEAHRG